MIAFNEIGPGNSLRWTVRRTSYEDAFKYGRVLRRIRRERKMTQELLALKSETGKTYISQIERGYRVPSFVIMQCLACVLETTMGAMLTEAGI